MRFAPGSTQSLINPREISRVLVCRINSRIGNLAFLTPMLRLLWEALPNVRIDIATSCPQAPALLRGMPGVERILVFPQSTRRMIPDSLRALRQLRQVEYDLLIDPVPASSGSKLVRRFLRARHRIGLDTIRKPERCSNHGLTQVVRIVDHEEHRAQQPVSLLAHCLDLSSSCSRSGLPLRTLVEAPRLWLPLTGAEHQAGQVALETAAGAAALDRRVFGFFAHARGDKTVDAVWWRSFWQEFCALAPEAVPVEFLPCQQAEPVLPQHPALFVKDLRTLAAAMGHCRQFISADTGPMHLASSTAVPTLALFGRTDARLFRPRKFSDRAFELALCSPRFVARAAHARWLHALADIAWQERTQAVHLGFEVPDAINQPQHQVQGLGIEVEVFN